MPAGKMDLPDFTAFSAPSSIKIFPLTWRADEIHIFLAFCDFLFALNKVPYCTLFINWLIGLSHFPFVIITLHPAFVAILEAWILVTIPPFENEVLDGPAIISMSFVILVTSFINSLFLFLFGSSEKRPLTSENKIKRSTSHIWATRAASLSLSPNFISSVETVSFSLMTGMTFNCKSFNNVALALRCFLLVSVSSGASKIWADSRLNDFKTSFHAWDKWIWPTAAAACFSSNERFLTKFNCFLPNATDPEETIIICFFLSVKLWISFEKFFNQW